MKFEFRNFGSIEEASLELRGQNFIHRYRHLMK